MCLCRRTYLQTLRKELEMIVHIIVQLVPKPVPTVGNGSLMPYRFAT